MSAQKTSFVEDVDLNYIADRIDERYRKYFGKATDSQLNAWQNSMQYMRGIIADNDIPDNCGVAN